MAKIFTRVVLEILRAFVLSIWLVAGFLLWIPFLVRMTILFTGLVTISVMRNIDIPQAAQGLDSAVKFYVYGFQKINEIIQSIISGKVSKAKAMPLADGTIRDLAIHFGFTLLFWIITLVLIIPGGNTTTKLPENIQNINPIEKNTSDIDEQQNSASKTITTK